MLIKYDHYDLAVTPAIRRVWKLAAPPQMVTMNILAVTPAIRRVWKHAVHDGASLSHSGLQ